MDIIMSGSSTDGGPASSCHYFTGLIVGESAHQPVTTLIDLCHVDSPVNHYQCFTVHWIELLVKF